MRKVLKFLWKAWLVILLGPVVFLIAFGIGQLYALMALLALPFILAYEVVSRRADDARLNANELDELQRLYPRVPRHLLRQARWEDLMRAQGRDPEALAADAIPQTTGSGLRAISIS
ncbi:hypothetical protein VARIO8X_50161 [Burkholderiales bacterium 8X]|nr:hypothetical protein VARIO8X_50161 [Burkholderiales bacterium 8X]